MKKLKYFFHRLILLLIAVVICGSVYAQQRITGKVTSANDGQPLIGVNIFVKGTTTAIVTNPDGTYEITVPDGITTLDFSFIGFIPQSVLIKNQTSIDIVLTENVRLLNEEIVAGYDGTQKDQS